MQRVFVAALCLACGLAAQAAPSVSLVWGPSPTPGVVGYAVYYGVASEAYDSRLDAGSNLTALVTGLAAGQTYFFAVTAYDTNRAESPPSNEVSLTLPGVADLGFSSATVPSPASLGSSIIYTFVVTNSGPDIASGVTVSNNLSPNETFVAATASQGTFVNAGGVVTFQLRWLPAGGQATLTVTTVSPSPGILTDSARVSALTADPNPANNFAAATVLVINAAPSPSFVLATLVSFNQTNGAEPESALLQAADGNFYGTTHLGGTAGYGTLFRMTPAGALTTLVSFNQTNGSQPSAALIQGSDGNLYGTTLYGGQIGYGTIFQATTAGALNTLISFDRANGFAPYAGLVQGADGNFYGTTLAGGADGFGLAFQLSTSGTLTPLSSFDYTGYAAYAGLVQGNDGNLYGTTSRGGLNGYGTAFRTTPSGPLTTFATFNNSTGANPQAGLIQDAAGNFYGTTVNGGSGGYGTVFVLGAGGSFQPLFSFSGTNGANPQASLVQGADSSLYGTTAAGGAYGLGTVFCLSTNGAFTSLVSFNGTNGANPSAALVQGNDGNFYGTTAGGGSGNAGTIFRLSVITTPVVQGAIQEPGMLTLTWNATAGQSYLVQSCGELKQPAWKNLGRIITATNTTATYSTRIGPERQRFYRVVLLRAARPIVPVLTPTGGGLTLSWNSVPGQYYQVQYKTNLLQPNWLDLGVPVVATNASWSIPIVIGPDPQRFYRVVLLAGPPPVRPVLSQASGAVSLAWSAILGQSYQVQYTTNLVQANWMNLGNLITPTNAAVTVSDTIGPDPQRFYRILIAP